MPFHIQLLNGIIETTISGVITFGDMNEMPVAVEELERRFEITPHRLADLTAVSGAKIHFEDMARMANIRTNAPIRNMVKSALVATDQMQFGYARMFASLNHNPNITIQIFQTREAALEWISSETNLETGPKACTQPAFIVETGA